MCEKYNFNVFYQKIMTSSALQTGIMSSLLSDNGEVALLCGRK